MPDWRYWGRPPPDEASSTGSSAVRDRRRMPSVESAPASPIYYGGHHYGAQYYNPPSPTEPSAERNNDGFTPQPTAAARFFESIDFTEDGRKQRVGVLEWSQLGNWLHHTGNYAFAGLEDSKEPPSASLRLLYIPQIYDKTRLGISKPDWEAIAGHFQLHESAVPVFLENNGVFTRYLHRASPGSEVVEKIDFVMKVPNKRTIGFDAIALSYHLPTQRICVVHHGGALANWLALVEQLQQHTSFSSSSPNLWHHPLLVPVLAFAAHGQRAGQFRERVDRQIHQVERDTGYGVAGNFQQGGAPVPTTAANGGSTRRRNLDIESVLVRLQSYQTELASLSHVLRFNQDYGDFLARCLDEMDRVYRAVEDRTEAGRAAVMSEGLMHRLALPCSQTRAALSQVQSLRERVQSQTNLIFSLISSEENRISRLVSEASTKVAVASKRDSAAMKTIAVLTMLFLPATFVAAFFSMPMIEWNPDTGERPSATPYIWAYWVITVPLTVTLFVGWHLWAQAEEKASKDELEVARKRDKDRISGTW